MRPTADFLFWAGRIETIVFLLFLFHLLILWLLRENPLTRLLSAAWLVIFLALSITLFREFTMVPATDGVDSVLGHLYGGLWTESQALNGVLVRWQDVLLPIYIPWLSLWLLGLLGILFFSALNYRAKTRLR